MTSIEYDAKIALAIASHKACPMPPDPIYRPIQVGAAGKQSIGFQRDDAGASISDKNKYYCELTGLYWAWKHFNAEYWGLVHYRRYFKDTLLSMRRGLDGVMSGAKASKLLADADVILPYKQIYLIETLESHYAHTHDANDLKVARQVIADLCPEYVEDWDCVMRRRSAHMFNMFLMKDELASEYCEWMFSILFELEKRLEVSGRSDFQSRVYGRISEFLIDVWLNHNNYKYKEVPWVYIGKVDWVRKISSFIKAKYAGVKYERSF